MQYIAAISAAVIAVALLLVWIVGVRPRARQVDRDSVVSSVSMSYDTAATTDTMVSAQPSQPTASDQLDTTSSAAAMPLPEPPAQAVDTSHVSAPIPSATVPPQIAPPPPTPADPPMALPPQPHSADSAAALYGIDLSSKRLIIPVEGVKPSELQDTYNEARSEGRVHNATDIMAAKGTPVLVAADGTIVKLFESERGGITLYERDPDGHTIYYYAHLERYADGVHEGEEVHQGDVIGYVGDTGNAGAGNYHLHFGITITDSPTHYWGGVDVNPYPMLRRAQRLVRAEG